MTPAQIALEEALDAAVERAIESHSSVLDEYLLAISALSIGASDSPESARIWARLEALGRILSDLRAIRARVLEMP